MNTQEPQDIPSADDVRSSTPSAWRIANGLICRGREADGTLESTPRLVGRLVRVGVHDGTTQDGETYQKVEADLLTSEGLVSIGCNTSAKTSSITFAGAIVQVRPDELICVEAAAAKKPNRYGSFSTYANLSRVNEKREKVPIKVGRDESVSMDERLEALLEQIRAHPAFAPRPNRDEASSDATRNPERDAFDAECEARDWPDSWGAPDEHLVLANASLGKKLANLSELSADDWVRHLAGLKQNVKPGHVPKALSSAVQAHRAAKSDEFDPFA